MSPIFIYLLVINIVTFGVYGLDKWKAINYEWRIPEAILLILSAIGGALGGWLAMQIFRHKTNHLIFRLGLPIMIVAHCLLGYLIYTTLTSY